MSAFTSYRMEPLSREEMAAADPFDGGVFLSAPGMGGQEILAALTERIGSAVPAVAWDGIGAWVDPRGTDAGLIRDLWDGGRASDCG